MRHLRSRSAVLRRCGPGGPAPAAPLGVASRRNARNRRDNVRTSSNSHSRTTSGPQPASGSSTACRASRSVTRSSTARGDAENRVKEHKLDLFSARCSCNLFDAPAAVPTKPRSRRRGARLFRPDARPTGPNNACARANDALGRLRAPEPPPARCPADRPNRPPLRRDILAAPPIRQSVAETRPTSSRYATVAPVYEKCGLTPGMCSGVVDPAVRLCGEGPHQRPEGASVSDRYPMGRDRARGLGSAKPNRARPDSGCPSDPLASSSSNRTSGRMQTVTLPDQTPCRKRRVARLARLCRDVHGMRLAVVVPPVPCRQRGTASWRCWMLAVWCPFGSREIPAPPHCYGLR